VRAILYRDLVKSFVGTCGATWAGHFLLGFLEACCAFEETEAVRRQGGRGKLRVGGQSRCGGGAGAGGGGGRSSWSATWASTRAVRVVRVVVAVCLSG
jgi:hypothetical protein